MSHSDIFIFLNSLIWAALSFFFIYFIFVLFILPSIFMKIRIRRLYVAGYIFSTIKRGSTLALSTSLTGLKIFDLLKTEWLFWLDLINKKFSKSNKDLRVISALREELVGVNLYLNTLSFRPYNVVGVNPLSRRLAFESPLLLDVSRAKLILSTRYKTYLFNTKRFIFHTVYFSVMRNRIILENIVSEALYKILG